MRVFGRYLLFQAVGWGLGALALGALLYWDVISLWLAGALLFLLLVKDLIQFPFVRRAYEPSVSHGGGALLGALGQVERSRAPEAWVRVGPESWRARVRAGARELEVGETVEVCAIDGLVLIVRPVAAAQPPAQELGAVEERP